MDSCFTNDRLNVKLKPKNISKTLKETWLFYLFIPGNSVKKILNEVQCCEVLV